MAPDGLVGPKKMIDVVVGANVREARISAGKSAGDCAHYLRLTETAYCSKERGLDRFTASELVRLAIFLDAKVASFFAEIRGPT